MVTIYGYMNSRVTAAGRRFSQIGHSKRAVPIYLGRLVIIDVIPFLDKNACCLIL